MEVDVGSGGKIKMPLFLIFIVAGLFQLWLGYQGIEYHFGFGWALGALLVAFWFRFMLPITIGSYFGAVDVMGWDWYVGLAIAAPGLYFVAAALGFTAFDYFKSHINLKESDSNFLEHSKVEPKHSQPFLNDFKWLTNFKFIVGAIGLNASINYLFLYETFQLTNILYSYYFKIYYVLDTESWRSGEFVAPLFVTQLLVIGLGLYLTIKAFKADGAIENQIENNDLAKPPQNKSIADAQVTKNSPKTLPKAKVPLDPVDNGIKNNISKYPNAETAIEYDDRAKKAWTELVGTPDELKTKFMENLEKDPKQDVGKLKDDILKQYYKILNPFDTDEVNTAYGKAKAISEGCAAEFKRVYGVLGDTISPDDLLEKVKKKSQDITPEKLKDLRYAVLTRYHEEMIRCLKNMDYKVEPAGMYQGLTLEQAKEYKITCTKGYDTRVSQKELIQYAADELKKLERWRGIKGG